MIVRENGNVVVRATKLQKGTQYIMRTWGKEASYDVVKFAGFLSNGVVHETPQVKLKVMKDGDAYKFLTRGNKPFQGIMQDLCLVHADTKARITFAEYTAGQELPAAAVVETKATKQVKEVKPKASKKAAKAEPVFIEALPDAGEKSKEQIKRERDAQRKRDKRAAAKAAAAHVQDDPEVVADEVEPEVTEVVEQLVIVETEAPVEQAAA